MQIQLLIFTWKLDKKVTASKVYKWYVFYFCRYRSRWEKLNGNAGHLKYILNDKYFFLSYLYIFFTWQIFLNFWYTLYIYIVQLCMRIGVQSACKMRPPWNNNKKLWCIPSNITVSILSPGFVSSASRTIIKCFLRK